VRNIVTETISESIAVKERLLTHCTDDILKIAELLAECIQKGNKILLCGNGGSAADSQHIAAELVVRLRSNINRSAIPALALTVDTSILTAGSNDYGFEYVFARQVEALGNEGDVIIGFSTSGNSENVINAFNKAKVRGLKTVAMLGKDGGKMANSADAELIVPSDDTARIQETHILCGHILCDLLERKLFSELF
jgi:D-sedoheptulose 7-phosphate isomerase